LNFFPLPQGHGAFLPVLTRVGFVIGAALFNHGTPATNADNGSFAAGEKKAGVAPALNLAASHSRTGLRAGLAPRNA
jgi:hypothetical protein